MLTKQFAVIGVTSNRNSFGLKGFVAIAKDGTAFEAAANDLNLPKLNEFIDVPLDDSGRVNYSKRGWEIPRDLPKPPKKLIRDVFKKK
jgi:hypothetical protein